MKLTFTWNETTGEAVASKADLKRIHEAVSITEMDFLRDCIYIVTEEYNKALEEWRADFGQRRAQAMAKREADHV
jgi:hypothetical protein